MPLSVYHATTVNTPVSARGLTLYFGKDLVGSFPIQVTLTNNQSFVYDPHGDSFQRLFVTAGIIASTVATSVGPTSGSYSLAANLGKQFARYTAGPGIPGQEVE